METRCPFTFKIKTWDADNKKTLLNCGMGLADSFTAAMRDIEQHFGDTIVSIENIQMFETDSIISLPEEFCDKFAKADFPDIDFEEEVLNEV